MRLFFAAGIPEDIRLDLTSRVAAASGLGGVNRSRPDALHVTLRFLGDTPPERLAAAVAAGDQAARRSSFSLSISGVGAFPTDRLPTAFWAGLSGDLPALAATAAALERGLSVAGFKSEGRAFSPHLTLARARKGARLGLDATTVFRQALDGYTSRTFDIKEIHLFRSHLSPAGPRYDVLRTFPLS